MGEERERVEKKRKKDGVVEDGGEGEREEKRERGGKKRDRKRGEGEEGSVNLINQMLDHFKIGLAPKGCHGN